MSPLNLDTGIVQQEFPPPPTPALLLICPLHVLLQTLHLAPPSAQRTGACRADLEEPCRCHVLSKASGKRSPALGGLPVRRQCNPDPGNASPRALHLVSAGESNSISRPLAQTGFPRLSVNTFLKKKFLNLTTGRVSCYPSRQCRTHGFSVYFHAHKRGRQ